MNREFRIVMDEETSECVAEVLKDWLQDCNDLGGEWHGTDLVENVIRQVEGEKERLFSN